MFKMSLLVLMICSLTAFASEKFVISAALESFIFLQMIELDQNQIKIINSQIIETDHFIYNTAITSRYDNKRHPVFDVYYVTCLNPDDIFCDNTTLSMYRVDSKLRVQSSSDFPIPTFSVSTEKILKKSSYDFRLLLWPGGKYEERKLRKDGSPKSPDRSFPDGGSFWPSISEDGKVLAASLEAPGIKVWSFHPERRSRFLKTSDFPQSVALSGPIVKPDSSTVSFETQRKSYRFLFFRAFRYPDSTHEDPKSRIMKQKIDESTGDFVGTPKAFTQFSINPFNLTPQSVAVSPQANIVFFSEYSSSCRNQILMAQVFDPLSSTKIGDPQILTGCELTGGAFVGIQGIDVVSFPKKLHSSDD